MIRCAAHAARAPSQSLPAASRPSSWCRCRASARTVTTCSSLPPQTRRGRSTPPCDGEMPCRTVPRRTFRARVVLPRLDSILWLISGTRFAPASSFPLSLPVAIIATAPPPPPPSPAAVSRSASTSRCPRHTPASPCSRSTSATRPIRWHLLTSRSWRHAQKGEDEWHSPPLSDGKSRCMC